jgi:hypothetical protein
LLRRKEQGAMITSRGRSMSILAIVSLAGLVGGCGGSSDDAEAEAQNVLQNIKALKPGEILIHGQRREKYSGPYTLQRGGYVLRFQREGESGKLTVALESQRGSKQAPYQLLLADSEQKAGSREVTLSGNFYVHIRSTAEGYVLRFTPKTRGG